MSLPLTVRLPIDPDGNNPNNYVAKEEHTLTNRPNRLFKPNYGSFYTASLEVYDMATSQRLKRGTDYICTQPRNIAIAKYGLEACSFIIIINPNISSKVYINYQAVGGYYSFISDLLPDLLDKLNNDNRVVYWKDIIGVPKYFNPTHHLHRIGDVYGFEYFVDAINNLSDTVALGDAAKIQIYLDYFKGLLDEFKLQDLWDAFNTHLAAVNPHGITASMVGAYTKVEINTKVTNLQDQIDALKRDKLDRTEVDLTHFTNKNNPHDTTAAQVGAYTKAQSDTITNALDSRLQTHVNNFNNPHKTTAAQVGAYTKAETDALINGVGKKVDDLKALLLDSNNKLKQDRVPISTQPFNELRWNVNGLYFGTAPDPSLATVYVNASTGEDIASTYTDPRGTFSKPFKTIWFALAQGPANVTRMILLAESQIHYVEPTKPMNLRGGKLTFRPYGTKTDAIPIYIGNNKLVARPEALETLNCRIVFRGITINDSADPNISYVNASVGSISGNPKVSFQAIKFINDTTWTGSTILTHLRNAEWPAKYRWSSQSARFSYESLGGEIDFSNCSFDTGGSAGVQRGMGFFMHNHYLHRTDILFSYQSMNLDRWKGANWFLSSVALDCFGVFNIADNEVWTRYINAQTVYLGRYANVRTTTYPPGQLNAFNKLPAIVEAWDSGALSGGHRIAKGTNKWLNAGQTQAEVTLTPPIKAKRIILKGYMRLDEVGLMNDTSITITFLGASYTRTINNRRTGSSGHGYHSGFYIPFDRIIDVSETTYITAGEIPAGVAQKVIAAANNNFAEVYCYAEVYPNL